MAWAKPQRGTGKTMSTLLFMPWCKIDRTYKIGEIEILPFERNKPIGGFDEEAQRHVNKIMVMHKTIQNEPVDRAALVRYQNKSVIDELTDREIEIAKDYLELACFCALAHRKYFYPVGAYCNSDCFSFYVQKFDDAEDTCLVTRRREGRNKSLWQMDEIAITVPIHVHPIGGITLDQRLLDAVIAFRQGAGNNKWGKWQNAISCFNRANSDSDRVSYQIEWILLCSAFERILEADTDYEDVARKFSDGFKPADPIKVRDADRVSDKWKKPDAPLRHEWMREFYRIRGDFAHGKLNTRQPVVWEPLEHLVLATIAFPLLVKSLLQKDCKYKFTDDDRAQIDCFEKFADTKNFLEKPPDQQSGLDSHWSRLCEGRESRLSTERAVDRAYRECKRRGLPVEELGWSDESSGNGA